MTQLILIRHGETVWNRERRMQGHSDSPLSDTGVRQARLLADRLAQVEFDVLYSSDSERAHRTARGIAQATRRPIMVEPRLRERHFGVFEGLTNNEIRDAYPDDFVRFESRDPEYVVPGGESALAFGARVLGCLREIAERHADSVVVAVTHGLVLDQVYRAAHGLPLNVPRGNELINASLNTFHYDSGRWLLERWGDAAHLADDTAVHAAK